MPAAKLPNGIAIPCRGMALAECEPACDLPSLFLLIGVADLSSCARNPGADHVDSPGAGSDSMTRRRHDRRGGTTAAAAAGSPQSRRSSSRHPADIDAWAARRRLATAAPGAVCSRHAPPARRHRPPTTRTSWPRPTPARQSHHPAKNLPARRHSHRRQAVRSAPATRSISGGSAWINGRSAETVNAARDLLGKAEHRARTTCSAGAPDRVRRRARRPRSSPR